MSDFDLQPGENPIDTWTINYIPPGGGRYTGELMVTDQRLLFDAQFATSIIGSLRELIIYKGSHGYLSISRAAIESVQVQSGFFKKRVIVSVGGQPHTFDYGMLSVKKLAEALQGG